MQQPEVVVIGESLTPETCWVLARLNMLERCSRARSVKKYSVQRRRV